MSRHTGWVELDAVLEILLGFIKVTAISQLSCQMNAGSKMALIIEKALFEMVN